MLRDVHVSYHQAAAIPVQMSERRSSCVLLSNEAVHTRYEGSMHAILLSIRDQRSRTAILSEIITTGNTSQPTMFRDATECSTFVTKRRAHVHIRSRNFIQRVQHALFTTHAASCDHSLARADHDGMPCFEFDRELGVPVLDGYVEMNAVRVYSLIAL